MDQKLYPGNHLSTPKKRCYSKEFEKENRQENSDHQENFIQLGSLKRQKNNSRQILSTSPSLANILQSPPSIINEKQILQKEIRTISNKNSPSLSPPLTPSSPEENKNPIRRRQSERLNGK